MQLKAPPEEEKKRYCADCNTLLVGEETIWCRICMSKWRKDPEKQNSIAYLRSLKNKGG